MIENLLKATIRDVADFPKTGIVFKDITPILKDANLCNLVTEEFVQRLSGISFDVIAGIESRGFLFGLMVANRLGIPFIPIRKEGKLPAHTTKQAYDLEYGSATIEIHTDAFEPGTRVLIHDDLLATGGTVVAASKLVQQLGGIVAGYGFVISLDFLNGRQRLLPYSNQLISLASY
ncbi:adenine phosphoribosyltransferase [Olivibacter sp. XZL3]|uniref:adenine phosphoribosyltransferase n=1 Tax=Olivibacter sp. XZL3 TaxID=1735116 RepID=UPI0010665503|nr:adenine phosphoribosyltransferase [Olivibacter sp. XZL3]